MFKIGEFSRLVRVSPRMLRHYEKCGLFLPAEIDRFTGYRQYSAGQIPLLTNIAELRDMGFSIDEIGDILPRLDESAYMEGVLRAQTARVKDSIRAEQAKLERLAQMSHDMRKEQGIMVYEVALRPLPPVKVISLRGIIPHYRDEGILWEKLGKYAAEHRIPCEGDGYATYFDEEYKEASPDVEIAMPVKAPLESSGEFVYREYDEIPLAAVVRFTGPFDGGYDAASEKLATWMEQNGYTFAGPMRGHVIVAPDTEPDPQKWETELQAPVKKL